MTPKPTDYTAPTPEQVAAALAALAAEPKAAPKAPRRRTPRRPAAPAATAVYVDAALQPAEQGIRDFLDALRGAHGPLYIGRATYAGQPAVVIALAGRTGPHDSRPVAIVVDPDQVRILMPDEAHPGAHRAPAATPDTRPLHTGLYL